MICLALTGATLDEDLSLLHSHTDRIDMAELRIDLLNAGAQAEIGGFPERINKSLARRLPLIYTVRRSSDGGSYVGSEEDRLKLLQEGISAGIDYVDLESDLRGTRVGKKVEELARKVGCEVIRSIHEPAGQPAELATLVRRLSDGGREIAKLAVTPTSTSDLAALLRAADHTSDIRKILIGMGPHGIPTRILSRRFGSMLTYASDPGGVQAAPGHIGPAELAGLYRFREISPTTRFFGVIGSPVAHSRSPEYHNRRFSADRLDARYIPILVDDVEAFQEFSDRLPLHGVSVTIPHKRSVLRYLSDMDSGTNAAGSCNTLIRRLPVDARTDPPKWSGVNTDVPGFLAPLRHALGRVRPGIGATVIGAGGAARAIASALLRESVRVLVVNRTADRASGLVADLRKLATESGVAASVSIAAAPLTPDMNVADHRDVIVQATSLGMNGSGDPAPWMVFDGSELVYDIVYTPPETPFILRARSAGCLTVTGDQMFDAQADAQYQLFSQLVLS